MNIMDEFSKPAEKLQKNSFHGHAFCFVPPISAWRQRLLTLTEDKKGKSNRGIEEDNVKTNEVFEV